MDAPLLESLEGSGVFCFNWRAWADSYGVIFIREGLERGSVGTALQTQPWILNIIQLQLSDQLFFSFQRAKLMKHTLDRDSQCLPLASFCPWNQLSWHVCAHLLCYLFPHVRNLIWALRVWALPGNAAVHAGAAPSGVWSRDAFHDVNSKGSRGLRTPRCVLSLSVSQKPEQCLFEEMSSKCFSFFPVGRSSSLVFGPFLFSLVIKYTNAVSFGVFVYFVWSHPCRYLNTIGKQMANFELLDQICVCLCLLNSQTVNYGV